MQEERHLEAGTSLAAMGYKNTASMRSVQVAENVEIELKSAKSVWKATIVYVSLVLIVAISTIIGQYEVHSTLHIHDYDGAKINIGGRQRMLSKKFAMETGAVLLGHINNDTNVVETYIDKVDGTRALWIASKDNLLEGNVFHHLPLEESELILDKYEELDIPFAAMKDIGKEILKDASIEVTILNNPELFEQYILLANTSDPFLKQMNAIVNDYQTISDERIDTLILIEAIFLGISCVVFFLELIIVVPKVVKAVRKAGRELKEVSDPEEKIERMKKYKKMKRSTIIYIVSVISVAVATVIGQSFIQITLKIHAGDGARINVSGRQRMLSQRVALDTMVAIMGQTKDDSKITDKYRTSTAGAVALWSSSRVDLVEGNSAISIPVETDQAILDAFVELDGYSVKIIADIDALLPASGEIRTLNDAGVVDELLELISLSFEFLKRMNAITDDYQDISDTRITDLLLVEIIVLFFTAAILLVEIVFIVIPSVLHALRTQRALKYCAAKSPDYSAANPSPNFKLTVPTEEVKIGTAEV